MTKPAKPLVYVHSRQALARALECHPNSIPRWLKEHPDDPDLDKLRTNDGRYHVPAWLEFIKRHGINVKAESDRDHDQSTAEIKRLQEIEKLGKMRDERLVTKHVLIEKKLAAKILGDSHERVKQLCRQIWEDELPPILAGLNAGAIRVEARKANDRLCVLMSEYARGMEGA